MVSDCSTLLHLTCFLYLFMLIQEPLVHSFKLFQSISKQDIIMYLSVDHSNDFQVFSFHN